MPTWFTVYCTRSLQQLTPADLADHLRGAHFDWYTLAETFGIEDETVVASAVAALRVEPALGELGKWCEVRYRADRYRPLLVYHWSEPDCVRQELTEAEENYLCGRAGRVASRVRATLSRVTEVAAVVLIDGQLSDMGLVIAGQVSEYLADLGAGLIRDTEDAWWAVRRGVPKLLLRKT